MYSGLVGGFPFVAPVALLACVGGLAFVVCAFDGFLLWVRIAYACPTTASSYGWGVSLLKQIVRYKVARQSEVNRTKAGILERHTYIRKATPYNICASSGAPLCATSTRQPLYRTANCSRFVAQSSVDYDGGHEPMQAVSVHKSKHRQALRASLESSYVPSWLSYSYSRCLYCHNGARVQGGSMLCPHSISSTPLGTVSSTQLCMHGSVVVFKFLTKTHQDAREAVRLHFMIRTCICRRNSSSGWPGWLRPGPRSRWGTVAAAAPSCASAWRPSPAPSHPGGLATTLLPIASF